MNAVISVKDWKIKEGQLQGTYAVLVNGKEVAKQDFNTGYSSDKQYAFSADVIAKAQEIGKQLETELNSLLT